MTFFAFVYRFLTFVLKKIVPLHFIEKKCLAVLNVKKVWHNFFRVKSEIMKRKVNRKYKQ